MKRTGREREDESDEIIGKALNGELDGGLG